jgi:integrase
MVEVQSKNGFLDGVSERLLGSTQHERSLPKLQAPPKGSHELPHGPSNISSQNKSHLKKAPTCPDCGSLRINLDGPRVLSNGEKTQVLECKDCRRKFSENYLRCPGLRRGVHYAPEPEGRRSEKMDPRTEIKTVTRSDEKDLNLKDHLEVHLEAHLVQMKLDRYKPRTIQLAKSSLKVLRDRGADLLMPDSVKAVIAQQEKWSGNRVRNVCSAYTSFLQYLGLSWAPPKYTIIRKLPFIPTPKEIDDLIAGSPNPLAAFLKLLSETAMRRGEAIQVPWRDVDLERRIIMCNYPEKGSDTRIFSDLSGGLLNMLNNLPRVNEMLFGTITEDLLKNQLCRTRARLAFKLGNQHLNDIHFHTLRHWKATMLYHYGIPGEMDPHDLLEVAKFLGHRDLENTRMYIQLEKNLFKNIPVDKYVTRVAHNTEDSCRFIEDGFEYHTGSFEDGGKIFRKQKIGCSP